MKILHTADWHIGQLFHEHSSTFVHQQFLDWLLEILLSKQKEVLSISGVSEKQAIQPIICMGHPHAHQKAMIDVDQSVERIIMSGVECIGATAFHKDIR